MTRARSGPGAIPAVRPRMTPDMGLARGNLYSFPFENDHYHKHEAISKNMNIYLDIKVCLVTILTCKQEPTYD